MIEYMRRKEKSRYKSDALQELVDNFKIDPRKLIYGAAAYDESGNLVYDMAYCPNCGREFEYEINDLLCRYFISKWRSNITHES
ncbi:hypothetical protein [Holdemania massiliensis]|uniref:hypothetical protein n=1 Tax=Holdemania massiliensis TaxID=1468449 RepID=UPI00242BD993|nr:hypothetical protein [Holdemania massiliensis]